MLQGKGHALVMALGPVITSPLVEVETRGTPIPQGAIRSLGKGRPSIHANAERMLPWRAQVQFAIEAGMSASPYTAWPFLGPVSVFATFTVKKPTTAPKRRKTWPITRP